MKNKIEEFLKQYERATNSSNTELMGALYEETFLFGGPKGTQTVKKENFLPMIPKRKEFFAAMGLKSTTLHSFEEKMLSENYCSVDVKWTLHYEKDGKEPVDDSIGATYILFFDATSLKIVFQIDHQDLTERVKSLGLL